MKTLYLLKMTNGLPLSFYRVVDLIVVNSRSLMKQIYVDLKGGTCKILPMTIHFVLVRINKEMIRKRSF